MSPFISKTTSLVVLAATFLGASPVQAACAISGKDGATTLECDSQTLSKGKGATASRAASAAPGEVFVAPNSPAGNLTAETALRPEAASLRPVTKEEEKAALEAVQPRK
jgi:hypothetical protein